MSRVKSLKGGGDKWARKMHDAHVHEITNKAITIFAAHNKAQKALWQSLINLGAPTSVIKSKLSEAEQKTMRQVNEMIRKKGFASDIPEKAINKIRDYQQGFQYTEWRNREPPTAKGKELWLMEQPYNHNMLSGIPKPQRPAPYVRPSTPKRSATPRPSTPKRPAPYVRPSTPKRQSPEKPRPKSILKKEVRRDLSDEFVDILEQLDAGESLDDLISSVPKDMHADLIEMLLVRNDEILRPYNVKDLVVDDKELKKYIKQIKEGRFTKKRIAGKKMKKVWPIMTKVTDGLSVINQVRHNFDDEIQAMESGVPFKSVYDVVPKPQHKMFVIEVFKYVVDLIEDYPEDEILSRPNLSRLQEPDKTKFQMYVRLIKQNNDNLFELVPDKLSKVVAILTNGLRSIIMEQQRLKGQLAQMMQQGGGAFDTQFQQIERGQPFLQTYKSIRPAFKGRFLVDTLKYVINLVHEYPSVEILAQENLSQLDKRYVPKFKDYINSIKLKTPLLQIELQDDKGQKKLLAVLSIMMSGLRPIIAQEAAVKKQFRQTFE
jgi:hypothetical protein